MADTPLARRERPLSPHLQIYRLGLTGWMSISHRITGVALSVGLLLLVWWLAAAASGPGAFEDVQAFIGSWFGLLLLFGWSFAAFYHLCNGIRHLVWDTGHALKLEQVYFGGWITLGAAIGLTVLTWIVGLSAW